MYEADPRGVGARIRAAREARGEDVGPVAVVCGISTFQLGKIERGDYVSAPIKIGRAIERLALRYRLTAVPAAPTAGTASAPISSTPIARAEDTRPVDYTDAAQVISWLDEIKVRDRTVHESLLWHIQVLAGHVPARPGRATISGSRKPTPHRRPR